CADVTVKGVMNGRLPNKMSQVYNVDGYKKGVSFPGDGNSQKAGPGPIKSEVVEASRKKSL
ncbi:hypothetical protein BGZ65_009265, partial [Modicella reniformis]